MRGLLTGLAERRLGEVVEARLAEEPVVVLNGPRTVGKSTLLSQLADRLGRAVIDCDDLATRAAVRSDPARFAESDQPVLIDEYQHVPELLDAIKAQLNRDLRPGRYISGRSNAVDNPARSRASPYRTGGHHSGASAVPGRNRWHTRDIHNQAARRRRDRDGPVTGSRRPATSTPSSRSTSGGTAVALRRPPGRSAPAGSSTTSTWSSTRMSWTSHGSGSARCCPGCSASSPPDPARS